MKFITIYCEPVAQPGQSDGLLIRRSRVRIPSGSHPSCLVFLYATKNLKNSEKTRTLMKAVIFLVLFLLTLIKMVNGASITEISFKNPEFIEIYSNTPVDLKYLYDSGGLSKKNELSLIKKHNSSCYLIITKSFPYDIENLNCTVYTNNKNVLGYYGLKDKGEVLTIVFVEGNETKNISFLPEKEYSFDDNMSLKPVLNSISLFSIGRVDIESNVSNISFQHREESKTEKFNCHNIIFQIIPDDEVVSQKLSYKFNTNLKDNYTITYWITDLYGNIVKNKVTTKCLRKKTYTPNSEVVTPYVIKARLKYRNCFVGNETMIIFRPDLKDIKEKKTYIKVKNLKRIKEDKQLIIEVCRGDSRKHVMKVKINGKVVQKLDLSKNSLIRLYVNLEPFLDNYDLLDIVIEGLGMKKEIKIDNQENSRREIHEASDKKVTNKIIVKNKKIKKKKINSLKILNYSSNNVKFEFETSYNGNITCYVLEGRRKVSDKFYTIKNKTVASLNFSVTKTPSTLKLLCKIRPLNRSYYEYVSKEFLLFDQPFTSIKENVSFRTKKYNLSVPKGVLYSYNREMIENGKNIFIGALSLLLVTLLIKF